MKFITFFVSPSFKPFNKLLKHEKQIAAHYKFVILIPFMLYFFFFTGLTAIEAWMLACILFVFGALVEYAVILFRRQIFAKQQVINYP